MSFVKRIIQKPPTLFPWVALFHIVFLLYSIYIYSSEPFPSRGWVQPLWWLTYTVVWLFVCDMKKWAAYAYCGLIILNILLRFVFKSPSDINDFTDALFPLDVLFGFFVLFYFKQFD